MDWGEALEAYRDGKIKRQDLWPYWKQKVESLMKLEIAADRECQLLPLFENSWGPHDAADHLFRVWALKGWLNPVVAHKEGGAVHGRMLAGHL